jgi:hypothetical protein
VHDELQYAVPQVCDIKNAPVEKCQLWKAEGFSHSRVMAPVMQALTGITISMTKHPNIKPGQDYKGYQ